MFQYVFYPELARVVHDTSDGYLSDIGYSYGVLQNEFGVGLPIVEIGAEFDRPIRIDDTVEITLEPTLGESSLRFDYRANHEDGTRAFTAFEQRACVRLGESESTSLPDDLRRAIEASME